jgi:hypothetical protein
MASVSSKASGKQGDEGEQQVERMDFAEAELLPDHQQQAGQAEGQSGPLAARYFAAAAGDPDRRQHRLQTDQQRRQPGAHAGLDGRPDAAQVARMHQHAGDGQVAPLAPAARPGRAHQHGPGQKAQPRQRVAHGQEFHRRGMRHAVTRHDEAGRPDHDEHGGHRPHQRVGPAGGRHFFTRRRISGNALRR